MKVFEYIPEGIKDCKVRVWLHSYEGNEIAKRIRPAVAICPGGAYRMVSEREAEPVAKVFFAAGYHTFILNYSVLEKAKDFQPLCQLAAAIADIRKNAEEWSVDCEKIAVCGFSAGGHLAASLGTLFKRNKKKSHPPPPFSGVFDSARVGWGEQGLSLCALNKLP